MKAWMDIYRLIGAYRWTLPILIGLGVVASLAEGFGIGLLIPFAQVVLGVEALGGGHNLFLKGINWIAASVGTQHTALLLGFAIIGFIGLQTVLWLCYIAGAQWMKERVIHDVRCALTERLMAIDYSLFTERSAGDYYNVVIGESWRATEGVSAFLTAMSRSIVTLVFVTLLLLLSWKLVVFSAIVVGASSLLVRFLSAWSSRWGEIAAGGGTRMSERALGILTGMRTVRMYAREELELSAFAKESNINRRAFTRMWALCMAVGPILEGIFVPAFVAMIFLAGYLSLPVPQLVAFLALMYRLVPHIRAIAEARVTITRTAPAVDPIIAIYDLPVPALATSQHVFTALGDALAFENVSFSYTSADGDDCAAISDVSFRIPKGKTVALVGGSGSGKSTLVALLLGLYKPDAGQVTLDGTPLDAVEIKSWRRRVGFAGQDAHLFPGTIADNIAFGNPDAPRADIENAARRAGIGEFASRLPRGLDTTITRDGLDLSGGQRQRIAIARALLIDPELLVLDEATNALDNITERTIQEMLREVSREKTTLIVAHRMSTIRHADWVIALDRGRIAEQGPPAELLRGNAEFARLYELESVASLSDATEKAAE